MPKISHEERWAVRDLEAKQCCGSLTNVQRLFLWSIFFLVVLWIGHIIEVVMPPMAEEGPPLLWSPGRRNTNQQKSSSSPPSSSSAAAAAAASLHITVAIYPSSTLAPQSRYLSTLLRHHSTAAAAGGTTFSFREYEDLHDAIADLHAGDVVLYRGNVTLPGSIYHSRSYHGHQGCLYCHAKGNTLLHDVVTRTLLSQPKPLTLIMAGDPLCKTIAPAAACHYHRFMRTTTSNHHDGPSDGDADDLEERMTTSGNPHHLVLPLPATTDITTTTALLPSSRRPLLLAIMAVDSHHPEVEKAAGLLVKSADLKASSSSIAIANSAGGGGAVLSRSRFVLLHTSSSSLDTMIAALDAGTIPLLLTTTTGGCVDLPTWLQSAGAPRALLQPAAANAEEIAEKVRGLVREGVDEQQSLVMEWWVRYKQAMVGGIVDFAIAARSSSRLEKGGSSRSAPLCRATPLDRRTEMGALLTYVEYYSGGGGDGGSSSSSWFDAGRGTSDKEGVCEGLCSVGEDPSIDESSACFSEDCVPAPIAAFSCGGDGGDSSREEEVKGRRRQVRGGRV